jgi:hypothetical protein
MDETTTATTDTNTPKKKRLQQVTFFRVAEDGPGVLVESAKEAVYYNYVGGFHSLAMMYPYPTAAEVEAVRDGETQFRVTKVDGVIFLLSKFGDLNWADSPYSWWLNAPENRTIPAVLAPDECITMDVSLIDGSTGITAAQRDTTLTHEVSKTLVEAIRRQAYTRWEGPQAYHKKLGKINSRHSIKDLVAQAQ